MPALAVKKPEASQESLMPAYHPVACPYSLQCSRIRRRFDCASDGNERGKATALSAYYASCQRDGQFPSPVYVAEVEQKGFSIGEIACYNGALVGEMRRAPELS